MCAVQVGGVVCVHVCRRVRAGSGEWHVCRWQCAGVQVCAGVRARAGVGRCAVCAVCEYVRGAGGRRRVGQERVRSADR